ncbi:T6SS effector BTH_I2691 family protein [Chromobacterium sp. Beijing]|uniref:T6SS effector BTH_I2691 family protein n=1 Tax=Chromobacterium sp. Beijing TaxID=2735795 RepID=UPI001F46D370|nr:T6SS effector BTH_I2691 family protein [Chromobacterium sp. Beijing]UJB30811.1 hypothetical protein HQN78_06930 [Chromobacterium sp. Beijing]
MSKPECTQQKSCDYCEKRGVPILPLRYAVAMPNAGAPKPASPPSIALPAVSGQYTLRLLRSGYLYVYDEARKRWDDYFVTADGYFCKIFPVKGQPTPVPSKAFNCCDPSHRALASCITIPDAKRATKVWLGFSDAQWTDDVRKRHESADYRKQHMRCVDVNAYTAGADGKHCLPIKNVGAKVAEYTLDDTALKKALSFSQHAATGRKSGTALLIAESERLMPQKGFAIALEDPIGIAADLSALMGYQLYNYTNDKSRKRPFMASSAILQIESAVKEQALEAENAAAEELADKMLSEPDIGMLFSSYRDKKIKKSEDMRAVTEAQAQLAEKNAWQKYRDKFDEPAMKNWRNKFDEDFKEFDKSYIAPLAETHATWMKSKYMSYYFECNFDSKSADSGIVYAKAALLCIHGTQDKAACFNLYVDWLEKDSISKENILLRALTLNLEKTSTDINKALKLSIDWRGLPLDPIIGAFGKSLERLTSGTVDTIGGLITALYGP